MSRAFVRENDDLTDDLPERPVSTAPNLVTREGLAAIDANVERLTKELSDAGDDQAARVRIGRDLRYWLARRASAHIAQAPLDTEKVHFGSTITIERDDGRALQYRIVGEDEANPEQGTVSHISPMARALLGKSVGDHVRVAKSDVEIIAIN